MDFSKDLFSEKFLKLNPLNQKLIIKSFEESTILRAEAERLNSECESIKNCISENKPDIDLNRLQARLNRILKEMRNLSIKVDGFIKNAKQYFKKFEPQVNRTRENSKNPAEIAIHLTSHEIFFFRTRYYEQTSRKISRAKLARAKTQHPKKSQKAKRPVK